MKGSDVCDKCGEEIVVHLDYFMKVVVLPMVGIACALILLFWWLSTWWY